ncbi:hypothetical protein HMSSN139_46640 [Paenibacillus sp. HMSSN-139]|nr:hypothetical protein HMSSN139_46640 [Paenibacillus sp. HMSSN-139]
MKAVALLKKTPDIDASRIFVAGHSQGGYAMPLITAGDTAGDIAGTILMSGPSGNSPTCWPSSKPSLSAV